MTRSILYDNTRIAVARILGDGTRQRTKTFSELQSHYLFQDRFGRPGKGNDKGKVEGLVGFARRDFMVPGPAFDCFETFNADLALRCRKQLAERLRGHSETIGERLECDLAALRKPLPPPYDACEKVPTTVSSLSLVRYRGNDYSVPAHIRPNLSAGQKFNSLLGFHGLRKSAVVLLLEAGATEAEVSAITGQTMQMVAHYARQVNQR